MEHLGARSILGRLSIPKPKIMKLSPILLGCILVISSGSIAFAGKVAPKIATGQAINFKCQTRGSIVNVVLKPNLKYKATTNVSSPVSGNYVVAAGPAYRLTSGGLKDSSIVKQGGTFYLVATAQEANAAQLAAVDKAVACK
jgi:hypothetical protein